MHEDLGSGISRRKFLTSASAAAAAAAVPAAFAQNAWARSARRFIGPDAGLPSVAQLMEWEDTMVGFGQRIGGTASHGRWLDFVEQKFQEAGLATIRDTQYLSAAEPHWNATRWSLTLLSNRWPQPVPVASYYPYSGGPQGATVEGDFVDVGAGAASDFAGANLSGKIALVTETFPAQFDTYGVWYPTFDFLYDPDHTITPTTPFRKACFNAFSPTLSAVPALAASAGCAGVVISLDAAPADAAGQYVPFARPLTPVPILYVDRNTGAALRQRLASAPSQARLELVAESGPAGVDNLTAILPGSNTEEYLWVLSHSDGCDECEENGGLALISLARQFAARPQSARQRSMAFHLTLHMTPYIASNGAYFQTSQPEIYSKVVALMHMEHFGQRDWLDDPTTDTYRPTGYSELAFMDVSANQTLINTVSTAIQVEDLRRTAVTKSTFSVGAQYDGVLPTVGFMTYPNQMLAWGETRNFRQFTQNLDKFDPIRMQAEVRTLTRILGDIDALPTSSLALGATS